MAQTDVNQRWQAEMAPYFADADARAGQAPDRRFERIAEIFHLD